VLYHLKHPLLALEKVCALSTDLAIVSSFTIDDYRRPLPDILSDLPRLDFYETDELGGQLDNWFGPNLACLMALCRAAGFARVGLLDISGQSATVACYRKWLPLASSPNAAAGPRLLSATNARSCGINFQSLASEEQIACWFELEETSMARESVKPEVGGYGVPCLHLSKQAGNAWQCNFRLPPGLTPGWHSVALRVGDSAPSERLRVAVDIPFVVSELAIHSACDAFSWQPNTIVQTADGRAGVSIWVRGLPENADRANVTAFLGSVELSMDAVTSSDGATMQLNAMLREPLPVGRYSLTVSAGGIKSDSIVVEIVA